jgi:thymidylate synthase
MPCSNFGSATAACRVSCISAALTSCHLYLNHAEQAALQLTREPYPLPRLVLARRPPSLFEYEYADFRIENYQHHPHIAAPVAV